MTLNDFNLDNFDRSEYLHFLQMLINYYFIQFQEELELVKKGN